MTEIIYLTEEVSDNVVLKSKDGDPMIGLGRTNNSIRRALEHHNRGSKASAGINFIDERDFENDGYTSNYVESKLHNVLTYLGFRRVDRESHFIDDVLKKSTTEVFTGKSKKEIKDLVNIGDTLSKEFIWNLCKYILENPNLFKIDFKPRFNQILIINKFLDVIDNSGLSSKILSELCARFGKTTTYLYLLLKMNEIYGTRVMILPGYVHSAFSSFKKEIDLYNDFNNIVYIDTKKENYEILYNKSLEEGKLIVIPCSLQVSDKDKFTFLKNYDSNKKMMVIDEADYGAHTDNSNEIIEYLDNGCVRIHTSGTSIDRAGKNLKIVDGIINFSYFELLQLKNGLSKYFDERYLTELDPILNKREIEFLTDAQNNKEYWMETLSSIPDINFYKISIPKKCFNGIKDIDDIYMTDWSKILEDPYKNKDIIKSLLKGLFGLDMDPSINKINLSKAIYKDSEKNVRCLHFFTGCRSNEKLEKLSNVFKETLRNYNIITLSGDNRITNETAEKEVKDLIEKTKEEGKDGVVILSVNMGARSFSVSEIEAVLLMYDGGLVSQTIQKTSRALTSGKDYNGDVKNVGNIVSLSFDPNRTDPIEQIILEESLKNKLKDESVESAVRRLIMSVNIFSILDDETGDCVEINKEDLITKFIQNTDYKRVVVSSVDYTSLLINDDDILVGLDGAKTFKASKNKMDKLLPSGKKFLDKRESGKEGKKDGENEYKKILERIREVVNMILNSTSTIESIDTSDIYSMNNKKSFIQILKSIKSDDNKNNEFIETFGIDSEILIKMCERKRINGDLIDLIMNEI